MPSVPRPKSTLGAVVELVLIVGFAIGLALLIQAFVVKPFQIPSGSMIPTLKVDQRVLVQRVSYHFTDPKIGDIIVFHPPYGAADTAEETEPGTGCATPPPPEQACAESVDEESEQNFIKRIVAGPGDELYIEDGHAIVNGEPVEDDFARPCAPGGRGCNLPEPITIPEDQYFMMGDNRGSSEDSRFWGPVPSDWIIGKAFATYWPLNRIGIF